MTATHISTSDRQRTGAGLSSLAHHVVSWDTVP